MVVGGEGDGADAGEAKVLCSRIDPRKKALAREVRKRPLGRPGACRCRAAPRGRRRTARLSYSDSNPKTPKLKLKPAFGRPRLMSIRFQKLRNSELLRRLRNSELSASQDSAGYLQLPHGGGGGDGGHAGAAVAGLGGLADRRRLVGPAGEAPHSLHKVCEVQI